MLLYEQEQPPLGASLIPSICGGHLDLVELLVSKGVDLNNLPDAVGGRWWGWKKREIVVSNIEHDAVNFFSIIMQEYGKSCLHYAAEYGHKDLVLLLIHKYRGDTRARDKVQSYKSIAHSNVVRSHAEMLGCYHD